MTTIHITTHSRLSPERVLEAGYDFSARRTEIFPAASTPYFEVHELSQTSADVTEGTPAGVGVNWERCRSDSSHPVKREGHSPVLGAGPVETRHRNA
jgi:hypothetical protein